MYVNWSVYVTACSQLSDSSVNHCQARGKSTSDRTDARTATQSKWIAGTKPQESISAPMPGVKKNVAFDKNGIHATKGFVATGLCASASAFLLTSPRKAPVHQPPDVAPQANDSKNNHVRNFPRWLQHCKPMALPVLALESLQHLGKLGQVQRPSRWGP